MRLVTAFVTCLALAACSTEKLQTPPVVRACFDVDAIATGKPVLLWASASDSDGVVQQLDWAVVSAPPGAVATVTGKGAKNEIAELSVTGSELGLYVVRVSAKDDDGLASEPDYVNVNLHEPYRFEVQVVCKEGCPSETTAEEGTRIALEARVLQGKASSFKWSASLRALPPSTFSAEPNLEPAEGQATVEIPAVPAASVLSVTVVADGSGSAKAQATLHLSVINSKDEPPEVTLDVRQPGALQPLPAEAVLLPGDALHVTARVADPNGDKATCSIVTRGVAAEVLTAPSDPCRATVYPRSGGALEIVAVAETSSPQAKAEQLKQVVIKPFQLESGGAALTSVAVSEGGLVIASAEQSQFFVYQANGARGGFSAPSGGAAAAVSRGAIPEMGVVGFAASAQLARYDFRNGTQKSAVPFPSEKQPSGTRSLAAGSSGRVFAATDKGLLLYGGAGQLTQWLPEGGLDASAVSVGPSPTGSTGGYVWFAEGSDIYYQPGEDVASWPASKSSAVGAIQGARVTCLSAGPSKLWDLWVGTGPADAGQPASGLLLFKNSVDPASGQARMNGAQAFFAQEGGIGAVEVERSGAYQGDAWAVAGQKLVRVSRAALNDPSGQRGAVALEIVADWGTAKPRAVAVGGTRKVAVATDQGLLTAP